MSRDGLGLAVAAKTFADAGDSLDEMSQGTGVSVESLSRWVPLLACPAVRSRHILAA
jgi:hypothetical protein